MLYSYVAQVAQLSSEQQKSENVHGDSYILERLLSSATSVLAIEEMCSIQGELFEVGLL
jgi:hypothetical protein